MWRSTIIDELDAEDCASKIESMINTLYTLQSKPIITENPEPKKILNQLCDSVVDFHATYLNLLITIKSDFFSSKAWPKLQKFLRDKKIIETKNQINSMKTSFGFFMENKILNYQEELKPIIEEAKKEYEIEKKWKSLRTKCELHLSNLYNIQGIILP